MMPLWYLGYLLLRLAARRLRSQAVYGFRPTFSICTSANATKHLNQLRWGNRGGGGIS